MILLVDETLSQCCDMEMDDLFSKHLSLQVKLPASEIAATINEFRSRHLAELTEVRFP